MSENKWLSTQHIRINGQRLWDSLMLMAKIGATVKGGCNRQALTSLDKEGRDLFVSWAEKAGCSTKVDPMGNIIARRSGKFNDYPSVLTGSHLDTQPTGGKFDGVYGVLAGLEVIRTLNDNEIETEHPIEVVVWTNEEGARFSPAMIGSGVWSGEFSLKYGHSRVDKEGKSIREELDRINYLGRDNFVPDSVKAAFEVHIEQGPILEIEDLQIGVLSGVQGMNWYDLIIEGQPCHAGPSPMESRQDPFMGLTIMMQRLYDMVAEFSPWSRLTFGDIKAEPGARNTVPERLIVAVDLRHPEQQTLDEMEQRFFKIVEEGAEQFGLKSSIKEEWRSPAVKFDQQCVQAVRKSVDMLGYSNMDMVSGAGHDSVYVSKVAPTSMIFIPCENGLSHNEAENAKLEDVEAGCNVLLHAMLKQSYH